MRFDEVTDKMAALEGEGDLSYGFWRDAHIEFFKREGTWEPDMSIIFETFRVTDILDAKFQADAPKHVEAERREAIAKGYNALAAEEASL